jgi:hypothetical protein
VRALSVLVLAIFMAGPGLRAECLLLCAKAGPPAARSSCHDEPADGAAIGAHHDCAAIAPAVITAIKRAGPESTASLLATSPQPPVVVRAARPDRLLHGPPRSAPLATVPVPLRI